ncbi:MAG: hypothetical protein AAF623_12760 [Planctomycetota bacterium]
MTKSEYKSMVVLVIDGLYANMLGPYGNTNVKTSNLNRLAAEGVLLENLIGRSPDFSTAVSTLLSTSTGSWLEELGDGGVRTVMMTDEERMQPFGQDFEEWITLFSEEPPILAENIEGTRMARFFAQATEWIRNLERGSLGYLHCKGLFDDWDAPYAFRRALADSEDPDPPDFSRCPHGDILNGEDPDKLLAIQQAWAAQIAIMDQFVGILYQQLRATEVGRDCLFCLTSLRGFPLGEHQVVGNGSTLDVKILNNESVHLPFFLVFPEDSVWDAYRGIRAANLIQPDWVGELLKTWFQSDFHAFNETLEKIAHPLPQKQNEYAVSRSDRQYSLQTHAWKLISSLDNDEPELYVKPDDLWESNDVSRRCRGVVEQMQELFGALSRQIETDFEIPEDLCQPMD